MAWLWRSHPDRWVDYQAGLTADTSLRTELLLANGGLPAECMQAGCLIGFFLAIALFVYAEVINHSKRYGHMHVFQQLQAV